jgi:hypothetical protein
VRKEPLAACWCSLQTCHVACRGFALDLASPNSPAACLPSPVSGAVLTLYQPPISPLLPPRSYRVFGGCVSKGGAAALRAAGGTGGQPSRPGVFV